MYKELTHRTTINGITFEAEYYIEDPADDGVWAGDAGVIGIDYTPGKKYAVLMQIINVADGEEWTYHLSDYAKGIILDEIENQEAY